MFEFFIENKLISSSQFGFKPGDSSCINQLLSITHEIYISFDEGLEVRILFLDITKAFDKVWHDDIIFKLTRNGSSGNLLNLLRDFSNERKQRVVLNRNFLHGKKCQCWSTSRFHTRSFIVFWFTLMIWQKAFQLIQSFLQMILLCFLW